MEEKIKKRVPVILDTDIGTDIDDTWALVMMLNSPELDVKLILTESGNTLYRAKIVAKMLEVAGRTDIPVGIGLKLSDDIDAQGKWVEDYDIDNYPGTIYKDGISAMNDIIMNSNDQVTLVSIGPVTNIAKALEMQPAIATKARFVGMHGSVRVGYNGSDEVNSEYNVRADIEACKKVFTAPWEITITPLDTCGLVILKDEKYMKVHTCESPLTKALMDNYRIWEIDCGWKTIKDAYGSYSSVLFDTVAIYLAFSEELLHMETIGIRVDDEGYTRIDEYAKKISCAMGWKDMAAFEDFLVERLIV